MILPRRRRIHTFVLLLAFMAAHQIGLSQQRPEGGLMVLKGATLIDGTGGPPLPEAVIVIEGDKFKAVGGKGTTYPSDATVLDLSGKFVIPGFVDGHTHYRPWSAELYLNHGVTTIIFQGARNSNGIGEEAYRASQQSSVRTPRIYDHGGHWLTLSASMNREQLRLAVRDWLKTNPDSAQLPTLTKGGNKDVVPWPEVLGEGPSLAESNQQVIQWAAEEIHEAGLVTLGHTEDCLDSVRAGLDIIEHLWGCAQHLMTPQELEGFQKGEYLHWGSFLKGQTKIDQMIKEMVQLGAYINPTLVYVFAGFSPLAHKHELEAYNLYRDPALMTYYSQNLALGLLQKLRSVQQYSTKYPAQVAIKHLSDKDWQELKEAYRLHGAFVKRWVELGGKVMGGVDDPQTGTAGLSNHWEMAMLVESGLTPMQALQAQTLWNAEYLTARRKTPTKPMVGWVGPGTYADLVVLTANPLDNIENTKKIERVMKGGQFVRLGYTPYFTTGVTEAQQNKQILDYVISTGMFASVELHEALDRPSSSALGMMGPLVAVFPTPEPEISAIAPHTVAEGSPEFEMLVEGVGFVLDSVVQVDGVAVPTTFVNLRTLKAKIPANAVASAIPNRFTPAGASQRVGIYGDRTVRITVFNGPPDGGTSNSVSLRVMAKWLADEKKLVN